MTYVAKIPGTVLSDEYLLQQPKPTPMSELPLVHVP